jgi:hypothetical protein
MVWMARIRFACCLSGTLLSIALAGYPDHSLLKSSPAGYTIGYATISLAVTPSLLNLPYEPIKDLTIVVQFFDGLDVLADQVTTD